MIRAAVVGAAGYAGIEVVRLLLGHPGIELVAVTSGGDAGRSVDDVYPSLAGCDLVFTKPDMDELSDIADIAFLGVPHTVALDIAPRLLEAGMKVFDLSADYRLKEPGVYEKWYGKQHTSPELLGRAVYGIPELYRDQLPGKDLVACPGCYPTATALAAAPALSGGICASLKVIVDAKSGVSGAGRKVKAETAFSVVNESVQPYGVASHRHTPEIIQTLTEARGEPMKVAFTPHLIPMTRGMLSAVYMEASDGLTTADALGVYRQRYEGEPFVTVHAEGRMPSTREVAGTNRAHIGVAVDEASGTLIAVCAIDNLVKGSAGQAVQCANVVLGFDETDGLKWPQPVV